MNLQRHIKVWIWAWGMGLAALMLALSLAGTQPAHSAEREGLYGAFGGEWSHIGAFDTGILQDDEFPDSWGVNAAGGFRWRSGFMVELLGEYRTYNGEAAAETLSVLPCALYELDTALTIDPYFGGCVGYGHVSTEHTARADLAKQKLAVEEPVLEPDAVIDENGGGWEWRVRGGLAFQLTEDGAWSVRTEYSYGCIEGLHLASAGEGDLCAHNAGGNLVVGF